MDPLLTETEIFFLFDIEQKIMVNTAHSDSDSELKIILFTLYSIVDVCLD